MTDEQIQKNRKLSWTPRRVGDIYCAPACGYGCTWTAYELARVRAEGVAERLGLGWKVRVNENLGWYSGVIDASGLWKVSINTSGSEVYGYTAFLGEMSVGGRWAESGETPEEAIRAVLRVARVELATLEKLVVSAKDLKLMTRMSP